MRRTIRAGKCTPRFYRRPLVSPLDAETANISSTRYLCAASSPSQIAQDPIQILDPGSQVPVPRGEEGNCGRGGAPAWPPLPSLFVNASRHHWLVLWGCSRPSDHLRPLPAITRTGRQNGRTIEFPLALNQHNFQGSSLSSRGSRPLILVTSATRTPEQGPRPQTRPYRALVVLKKGHSECHTLCGPLCPFETPSSGSKWSL